MGQTRIGEGKRIRPKLKAVPLMHQTQTLPCFRDAYTQTKREANQRALDDWTEGEMSDVNDPTRHTLVMYMFTGNERDQDIGVEEERAHSSSSAAATSSSVICRPKLITGNPDLESTSMLTGSSIWASPRVVNSAIVSDKESPRETASSSARRRTAGGRSTVVRIVASYMHQERITALCSTDAPTTAAASPSRPFGAMAAATAAGRSWRTDETCSRMPRRRWPF